MMDRHDIVRSVCDVHVAKHRVDNLKGRGGKQQLTLDQMRSCIKELELLEELLREELRLVENAEATDQGAHVGANG